MSTVAETQKRPGKVWGIFAQTEIMASPAKAYAPVCHAAVRPHHVRSNSAKHYDSMRACCSQFAVRLVPGCRAVCGRDNQLTPEETKAGWTLLFTARLALRKPGSEVAAGDSFVLRCLFESGGARADREDFSARRITATSSWSGTGRSSARRPNSGLIVRIQDRVFLNGNTPAISRHGQPGSSQPARQPPQRGQEYVSLRIPNHDDIRTPTRSCGPSPDGRYTHFSSARRPHAAGGRSTTRAWSYGEAHRALLNGEKWWMDLDAPEVARSMTNAGEGPSLELLVKQPARAAHLAPESWR